MIDDSNIRLKAMNTKDAALNEEKYIDKIESMTIKACTKGYAMENLGVYVSYICSAAAEHHIMLNPSFVSAALAVKVEEGIALALDPSVPIWQVATPVIIESESRRQVAGVSKKMGISRLWSMVFGEESNGDGARAATQHGGA
jgi:predicted unusual protein kinase regulating ubiquinone biosynthesis (AarF/ABC1/UbiB family)